MNELGRFEVPSGADRIAGWRADLGGVVTDRDLAMLGWVARFPCVTVDLLRTWLHQVAGGGRADSIVYARLRILERAHLIESERVLATTSRAVWATGDGLRAVGVAGRSVPPRIGTFEHDLMVSWLALTFTISKPTHQLVTERELKTAETPNQTETTTPVFSTPAESGQRRIYPDLVTVAPSGAHVVHEVERSPKERRRLERLMIAHLSNEHVASVRYYARPGSLFQRLEAAAEKVRTIAHQRGIIKPLTIVEYEGKVS